MIHRFSKNGGDATRIGSGQARVGIRTEMERTHPLIQLHDSESADHSLAVSVADEIVNISGADVIVYIRTDSELYDDVYEEDPDPTYESGKHLKGYFVPQPIAVQLTPWGVDVENQTTVVFNKERVYADFGKRMVRIGDLIELPYNASGINPDRFRVLNAFDSGNFRYNWLYWSCQVENITNDTTIDIDHK